MLSAVEKFIKTFNEKGILYCHYKGNNHIEDGLEGISDLDILVDKTQKKECKEALKEMGFVHFKSQEGSAFESVEDWINVDSETGKMIHIHLYYEIITGTKYVEEYRIPWEKQILETRIQDVNHGGIYISSREAELALVYAIMSLKKEKSVSEKNMKKLDFFKPVAEDEALEAFLKSVFKEEDAEKFGEILHRYYNLEKTYKIISSYAERRVSPLKTLLCHKKTDFKIKMKSKLNRKLKTNFVLKKTIEGNGFSVCFAGADGSGKSTISADVIKWLNWKIDSKNFYLGSGDQYHSLWKTITLKFGGRTSRTAPAADSKPEDKENNAVKAPAPVKRKFSILSYGMAVVNCLNEVGIAKYKYKTLKKAEKYMRKGGIAIFDRFPQMQFAGVYDGPKLDGVLKKFPKSIVINHFHKKERKLLELITTNYYPTILIKLILPPEESIRRKPDHNFKEVALKAEITEKLEFEKSQVEKIDATQLYENELIEVKNIIWEKVKSL